MDKLKEAIFRKTQESIQTKEKFFSQSADDIIECCHKMSLAFEQGSKLLVMGNGGSACDAQHMAVEFMHPVFEKRKALPALALTTDFALMSAISNDEDFALTFARQLPLLGKKGDMALAISTSGKSASIVRGLKVAREIGMLTIGLTGGDGGKMPELCDYCFTVPSFSIHRIQESHETFLHVMWDLIHVIQGAEDIT